MGGRHQASARSLPPANRTAPSPNDRLLSPPQPVDYNPAMPHEPTAAAASIPSTFEVGKHLLRITKVMEGRWSVSIDENRHPSTFATQAEAWEAGVREADRLDRAAAPAS